MRVNLSVYLPCVCVCVCVCVFGSGCLFFPTFFLLSASPGFLISIFPFVTGSSITYPPHSLSFFYHYRSVCSSPSLCLIYSPKKELSQMLTKLKNKSLLSLTVPPQSFYVLLLFCNFILIPLSSKYFLRRIKNNICPTDLWNTWDLRICDATRNWCVLLRQNSGDAFYAAHHETMNIYIQQLLS